MANKTKTQTEEVDLTKTMTKEAIGIYSEEGEEAKRGEFAEPLDITKHQNEAFRVEFVQKDEYDYDYEGQTRHGTSYICKLLKTSAAKCQELVGKRVGIYGKGLLNYQFKQLDVKPGDILVVTCGPKQAISGGREAYQTGLKRVKRA